MSTTKADKRDPHEVDDRCMDQRRTAVYLKVSTKTLQRHAKEGDGPQFMRVGKRRVVYAKSDVDAWLRGRTFNSIAHEKASRQEDDL